MTAAIGRRGRARAARVHAFRLGEAARVETVRHVRRSRGWRRMPGCWCQQGISRPIEDVVELVAVCQIHQRLAHVERGELDALRPAPRLAGGEPPAR